MLEEKTRIIKSEDKTIKIQINKGVFTMTIDEEKVAEQQLTTERFPCLPIGYSTTMRPLKRPQR